MAFKKISCNFFQSDPETSDSSAWSSSNGFVGATWIWQVCKVLHGFWTDSKVLQVAFQTLSPRYLLRRLGSLKLDVSSAPFKIYVRMACLAPLKGFHSGRVMRWLSMCEIWSVLQVPELHGSNLVFPWPRYWQFTGMEQEYHCRPSPPDIFWEHECLWNLMSVEHLLSCMLAFSLCMLRAWKGNTVSDPLPLISSGKMKVSEIWCQFSTF